jgi:formate dehydrogenase gamma subunit
VSTTAESTRSGSARYLRFTLSDRAEHMAQILTFVPLAITGLVQRYNGAGISQWTIDRLGGIESVRVIHRVFAAILMIALVYHLGAIGYRRFVLRKPRTMAPTRDDLSAARDMVAYNLGWRDAPPKQGRYTFEEKAEYWSLVWGTVLMVVTGFMLWNPIATAGILPGSFIPAAKAAHGAEAVLALLAIVVWHMYHVHVRHFNRSMFTGYLSIDEMEVEHPLELASPPVGDSPPPGELRDRRTRFLRVYGIGAVLLLAGIWAFVSFEETAITTVQPIENPDVFSPITTTTAVPITSTTTTPPTTTTTTPTEELAWTTFADTLLADCGLCHGTQAQLGGLSLATYEAALAGGTNGPAVVPGDPAASTLVTVQRAGGHAGQLDEAQIGALAEWIAAGAPEAAGGTPPTSIPAGDLVWADLEAVFAGSCATCHGANLQSGGLSLAGYDEALTGGESGPGIVPGDPEASVVYALQQAGGHPGQLDEAQLATLRAWIEAGAPEE